MRYSVEGSRTLVNCLNCLILHVMEQSTASNCSKSENKHSMSYIENLECFCVRMYSYQESLKLTNTFSSYWYSIIISSVHLITITYLLSHTSITYLLSHTYYHIPTITYLLSHTSITYLLSHTSITDLLSPTVDKYITHLFHSLRIHINVWVKMWQFSVIVRL